jgi:branched-chain amino acid transport system substrate-binding protein
MLPNAKFTAAEGGQEVVTGDTSGTAGNHGGGGSGGTVSPGDTSGGGASGAAGGAAGGSGGAAGGSGGGGAGGSGGAGASGAAAGPNQASDTGVTANSIKVGNITAEQGPLGPEAFTPTREGAKVFFLALNEKGGVNGRKVSFASCDDKESPAADKSCAQNLVESQGVFAFVGNTTDTYAAASYVNGKGVPDVGGYPIGNAYYKYPMLFTILGAEGYPRDGSAIGDGGKLYAQTGTYRYIKQQVGVTKAAVFYYFIPISKTAGLFIADGLQREGIQVVYEPGGGSGSNPANPSYDSDVVNMMHDGVDGIWNAIDIAGFQKLCLSMDRMDFRVKANVSTVQGWSQKVGTDFAKSCLPTIYVSSESVPYSDTSNAAVNEFRDAVKRYDPGVTLHQWVLEGYAAGRLFTDGVASMGAAPTRMGLVAWLNAQSEYKAGGLLNGVDWRPDDRNFGAPFPECFSLAKWDDGAGTFVAAAPTFTCETTDFYSYTPQDDGS